MALDTKIIGQALFNKFKESMRKGSTTADKQMDFIQIVRKTGSISKKVEKIKKMPKSVKVISPVFGAKIPFTDIPAKNIIPFGQVIPTGFDVDVNAPTTQDIVTEIETGEPATTTITPNITWDPIPDTPSPDEIIVEPHPFFKDEVTIGEDVDPILEETYPETNIIDTPLKDISVKDLGVNLDLNLPKLPDLGDLGKWGLIAGAGLIAILLLTRQK